MVVDVAEMLEELLDARESARGAGAEREKMGFLMLDRPAGILATQARHDRIVRMHDDAQGPAIEPGRGCHANRAEPAHADLAEAASGLETAYDLGAAVYAPLAGL